VKWLRLVQLILGHTFSGRWNRFFRVVCCCVLRIVLYRCVRSGCIVLQSAAAIVGSCGSRLLGQLLAVAGSGGAVPSFGSAILGASPKEGSPTWLIPLHPSGVLCRSFTATSFRSIARLLPSSSCAAILLSAFLLGSPVAGA
jgi:hypothetical protein